MSAETNETRDDMIQAAARALWEREFSTYEECCHSRSEMPRIAAVALDAASLAEPAYLVWSNEHRAWWGPNRSGYTGDVWSAGRYNVEDAAMCCDRRSWPQDAPPPEVMVLAPEHGRFALSVDEIRAVPEVMRARVAEATRKAVAERESVPAA